MKRLVLLVILVGAVGCKHKADPAERWLRDLKDPNARTRGYAAARLGEIRPGTDPEAYFKLPIGAGPLPMTPREEKIVDALNQLMFDDDDIYGGAHMSAAMALASLRPPGVQPGLVHCVATDFVADGTCMDAIIKISTPDVLAELLPMTLLDGDRGPGRVPVSQVVIYGLKQTGPAILPGVRKVIEADEDLELERTLIFKLLHRWEPDRAMEWAAETLVTALHSRFAEIRFQALYALDANGFEHERQAIAALVTDPNLNVRTTAAAMLEGRTWNRTIDREVETP